MKGSPKILARVPEFMTCGLQARLGESSAGIDEKPSLVTPSVHTRAVGGECSLQVAAVSLSSDFWDLSQGLKPPRQSKHFPFPAAASGWRCGPGCPSPGPHSLPCLRVPVLLTRRGLSHVPPGSEMQAELPDLATKNIDT